MAGMTVPTPEEVRLALASLDTRRQKIVAGLFAAMIREPARVRDREWIAQQLAEIAVLAGEFEADSPDAGVRAVQEFLQESAEELLSSSYLLFQRVGMDLEPQAAQGFSFEEAMRLGIGYLPQVAP